MQNFDILIIGAGPAGSSAALTLQNSSYKIGLFEKETFPREKICGDGVCDRSINTLKAINPKYFDEFLEIQPKECIQKTSLIYKKRRYDLHFSSFGYTCRRVDFDNFLFSLVQRDCKNVDIKQNTSITEVTKTENGYQCKSNTGETYSASIIIVANGAKSHIETSITNIPYIKEEQGVAARAYYEGLSGMQLDTIELHYKKEYFPGYLWVFPISEQIANVGFGYHLKDEKKFNKPIKELLNDWIQNDSELNTRFKNAKPISSIQGGLIPYNRNKFHCAGNNYMICGDAASLIDPISGGGIGSAMLSGYFAALQAEECCKTNDFSKSQTSKYQKRLLARIQREIKTRNFLQKTISKFPFLLDVLALIGKQTRLLQKIKNWYLK